MKSPGGSNKVPGASRAAAACRLLPGRCPDLSRLDANALPWIEKRDAAEKTLKSIVRRLEYLQEALFAESGQALLVVLQAMDTGGKDGTIRRVFGPLNPQGVSVTNFKAPHGGERAHDYLWRIHAAVPRYGMIGIFNRSHYEDVLVARVRKLAPAGEIERRYGQINAFEDYLANNRVRPVKIFLHIDRDEQRKRLERRLTRPDKHWKFDPSDLEDRKLWPAYLSAYARALSECGTKSAPWHVVPSNVKWSRDLLVAGIVCHALEAMAPSFPPPPENLEQFRLSD